MGKNIDFVLLPQLYHRLYNENRSKLPILEPTATELLCTVTYSLSAIPGKEHQKRSPLGRLVYSSVLTNACWDRFQHPPWPWPGINRLHNGWWMDFTFCSSIVLFSFFKLWIHYVCLLCQYYFRLGSHANKAYLNLNLHHGMSHLLNVHTHTHTHTHTNSHCHICTHTHTDDGKSIQLSGLISLQWHRAEKQDDGFYKGVEMGRCRGGISRLLLSCARYFYWTLRAHIFER